MRSRPRVCPCYSGLAYAACCSAFHDKLRHAPSPEALMRSRYAAYALGLGEYLVDTLSSDHDDRIVARGDLVLALSRARETQKYTGLCIMHASSEGSHGEVLFYARIFERGEDRSFAELSSFTREGREGQEWRYVCGDVLPRSSLPSEPCSMTREAFSEALDAANRDGRGRGRE